jgi:hypothetical protein
MQEGTALDRPAETRVSVRNDDSTFNAMSKSADYLPRFQLFSAKSDAVAMGKILPGRYGVVDGDRIIDLGTEVILSVHSWRPKAMFIDKAANTVENHYDPDADRFKEIQDKSFTPNSNCLFGPDFLIWIPKLQKWASFYMNSKTARRQSGGVREAIGQNGIKLGAKLIEAKGFKWHGPTVEPFSAPLDPAAPADEIEKQVYDFNNPVAVSVQPADQATVAQAAER